MAVGFIKVPRDFVESWGTKPNVCALYMHLLSTANLKPKDWQGTTIGRGELVTSTDRLATALRMTARKVRTILSNLVKDKRIITNTTNRWTKVTICDFDNTDDTKQASGLTATQEYTLDSAIEGIVKTTRTKLQLFKKPTIDEVRKYCNSTCSNVNPDEFWNFYESKGWLIGKTPMKNWHSALATWERRRTNTRPAAEILTDNSITKYQNDIIW